MKITDQIKTFEDAAKALGLINPFALPIVVDLPEKYAKAIVSNYKLWVIAEALNEGWNPDWSNYDEYKYYPWFDMDPGSAAGSGPCFSYLDFYCDFAYTLVGSRLVFKTKELAEYAGKQFLDLYKDVFTID